MPSNDSYIRYAALYVNEYETRVERQNKQAPNFHLLRSVHHLRYLPNKRISKRNLYFNGIGNTVKEIYYPVANEEIPFPKSEIRSSARNTGTLKPYSHHPMSLALTYVLIQQGTRKHTMTYAFQTHVKRIYIKIIRFAITTTK